MKSWSKKMVSLLLTVCFLLTSVMAAAADEPAAAVAAEEIMQQEEAASVEEIVLPETAQEETPAQEAGIVEEVPAEKEEAPAAEEIVEEAPAAQEPEVSEEKELAPAEPAAEEETGKEIAAEEVQAVEETPASTEPAAEVVPEEKEAEQTEQGQAEAPEAEAPVEIVADEPAEETVDEKAAEVSETPDKAVEEAAEKELVEEVVPEEELIEEELPEETVLDEALLLMGSIPDSLKLELNAAIATDMVQMYPRARNWELTLPSAGRLAIYINPAVDPLWTGNVDVTVWNEAVNTKLGGGSGSAAFVMDNIWLDAGNYNIVVDGGGSDIKYSIRATFSPATGAITGYKSYDDPYTLSSSTTYTRGVFTEQDKQDVFLFTVSEASHINIMTRVYEPGVTVSLARGTDMAVGFSKVIAAGSEANPNVQEIDEWLEAGRYYIVVKTSTTGIYDIYAYAQSAGEVDPEPNDGRGTAVEFAVGTTRHGLLSPWDSTDFYEITVPAPTEVEISIRESTNGLNAILYDKNMGSPVDMSSTSTGSSLTNPKEKAQQVRLEPNQPYYLQIARNSKTGPYTIVLTKKLTVESVSVTPGAGMFGTTFRVTPVVSGSPFVLGEYRLYKVTGGGPVEYWHERTSNLSWSLTALGDTAAQRATWTGTWYVTYEVYDGFNWTSKQRTPNFTVGGAPDITSIKVSTYSSDTVYVGYDFAVNVTTAGTTPTTYVYDIVDSHNALLKDKRQIKTTPSALMHVDGAGSGYRVMVTVFDAYGNHDVDYSTNYQPAFTAVSKTTVQGLKLTASGSTLVASLQTAFGTPVQTKYEIYCNDAKIDTKTVPVGNDFTYNTTSGGTYYMVATVYNGSVWLPPVASNSVTISDQFELFAVKPNVTSANVGDTVTFSAVYSGAPKSSIFYLNRVVSGNSKLYASWSGNGTSHAFKLSQPGYYAVYAIVTDGVVQKQLASTDFVHVTQAGATVVSVTTDKKVAAVGELIKATLVTAGSPTVKVDWYVQTAMGTVVEKWSGNSHSYTFKAPAADTYIVTAAVFGYFGDSGDFDSSDTFTTY